MFIFIAFTQTLHVPLDKAIYEPVTQSFVLNSLLASQLLRHEPCNTAVVHVFVRYELFYRRGCKRPMESLIFSRVENPTHADIGPRKHAHRRGQFLVLLKIKQNF